MSKPVSSRAAPSSSAPLAASRIALVATASTAAPRSRAPRSSARTSPGSRARARSRRRQRPARLQALGDPHGLLDVADPRATTRRARRRRPRAATSSSRGRRPRRRARPAAGLGAAGQQGQPREPRPRGRARPAAVPRTPSGSDCTGAPGPTCCHAVIRGRIGEDGSPEVVRVGGRGGETEPVTSGGGRWGPREAPAPGIQAAGGAGLVTNPLPAESAERRHACREAARHPRVKERLRGRRAPAARA